jgi:26S proteasome regulatory subunit T5
MATLENLEDLEREEKNDAEMKDAETGEKPEDGLDEEILNSSTRDIIARRRLLENDTRIMRSEFQRLTHEKASMHEKIKDNLDKIENNRYAELAPTALRTVYPTVSLTSW